MSDDRESVYECPRCGHTYTASYFGYRQDLCIDCIRTQSDKDKQQTGDRK